MTSKYSYDEADLKGAAEMFKSAFGEIYGEYLSHQVDEGASEINRFVMCRIAPHVWNRDHLPAKIRMFVAIASLATLGREEVRFFMRGAFANGATRQEIEEVLLVTGMEAGFPCAVLASKRLDEAEREHLAFMAEYEARQGKEA